MFKIGVAAVYNDIIKTINGESILGSGDIVVSGGTASGGKEVVSITNGIIESLEPNKVYILESSLNNPIFEIQSIVEPNVQYAEFTVIIIAESYIGGDGYVPTIILPDVIYWANGNIPDVSTSGIYELSIVWWWGFQSGYNAVLTPFKSV